MEFKKYSKHHQFSMFGSDYRREARAKFRAASLLKFKAEQLDNSKKKERLIEKAEEAENDAFMLMRTAEFLKEMENSEI